MYPVRLEKLMVRETLDGVLEPMIHAHQMGHDNGCSMFSVVSRISLWKYTARACEKPGLERDMEKPQEWVRTGRK